MDKIVIPLGNGYNIVAERNTGTEFDKEIVVGIETDLGYYSQDLCVIRPDYEIKNETITWKPDTCEVLVYGNETEEDYSDSFHIPVIQLEQKDE